MTSHLYQTLQDNNASVFKNVEFQAPSQSPEQAFHQLMTCVNWEPVSGKEGLFHVCLETFPSLFRQAAMDLHLYETTDFHSLNQKLHEEAVQEGRATGPYLCKSMMYRLWENEDFSKFKLQNHEHYQVVLYTQNQKVMGLYIWDKPKPSDRFMIIPEPTYHEGRKPHYQMHVENLGKAMFLVQPNERRQGIGRLLAQQMMQDIQTWRNENPHLTQPNHIPVLIAMDRAQALIEHQNPTFECIPHLPHHNNYRNKIWKRYLNDFDREERCYFKAVELIPKEKKLSLKAYSKLNFQP